MPTAINRLPLGLLGFLGIKNGGQYPTDLNQVLQPVWDLQLLYASANSDILSQTTAVNALGTLSFTNLTVPNGEAWLVMQLDAKSTTLTAGQTLQHAIVITDPAVTTSLVVSDSSPVATNGMRTAVGIQRDLWLGPGFQIGTLTEQIAAGPINVTMGVRLARFQL